MIIYPETPYTNIAKKLMVPDSDRTVWYYNYLKIVKFNQYLVYKRVHSVAYLQLFYLATKLGIFLNAILTAVCII